MPVNVRRFLYSMLATLGVIMMVPLTINVARLQSALEQFDPLATDGLGLDPEVSAWLGGLWLLFLAGTCVSVGFLYLALSTGHLKGWRPVGNGEPRCARCGTCDQRLSW
jgi:hypothetical protein